MIESEKIAKLYDIYRENKLSHAFLLETNDVDMCLSDILILIKKLNCPFEYEEKCEKECNVCNLIESANLPSLILIEPDGQTIKKDQILDMMAKFSTKPVYSRFNMYVVKNADRFNFSSANTLLKFLEEPEDNILGFFVTNNKENVISTIRSRCQLIECKYKIDSDFNFDDELLNEVKIFLLSIYKNKDDLLYNKTKMSGMYDRSSLEIFFYTMLYYIRECYLEKRKDIVLPIKNTSKENVIKIIVLVEEIIRYIKANGNLDLILDKFVIEMRCYYG